jgi:hypothetical protein
MANLPPKRSVTAVLATATGCVVAQFLLWSATPTDVLVRRPLPVPDVTAVSPSGEDNNMPLECILSCGDARWLTTAEFVSWNYQQTLRGERTYWQNGKSREPPPRPPDFSYVAYELVKGLRERRLLVVWLIDESRKISPEAPHIPRNFQRLYHELGLSLRSGSTPTLVSAIASVGTEFRLHTPEPVEDQRVLEQALAQVKTDEAQAEHIIRAIFDLLDTFRASANRERRQLVLLVLTEKPLNSLWVPAVPDELWDAPPAIFTLAPDGNLQSPK